MRAAQFFDERVEEWERRYSTPADYWYRRNTLGSRWLSRYLSLNSKCLEIGCAAGQFSELLHRQGHVVFGVDIAAGMIEAARRRLAPLGVPESHFQCCEPDSLPFDDNSFDLAIGLDVLPYVENQPHFLRDVYRVLKPNGLAFFNNVNRSSLFAGLTILRVLPTAFGGKYFVPGLAWWRSLYRFVRTGYSSGGFVDLSKAVQARSADMLDRFFVEAGFAIVKGYDMHNLRRLDRNPFDRKRFGAWAARQWAWNHFGLYRKRP